jgi:hypothetical protein
MKWKGGYSIDVKKYSRAGGKPKEKGKRAS